VVVFCLVAVGLGIGALGTSPTGPLEPNPTAPRNSGAAPGAAHPMPGAARLTISAFTVAPTAVFDHQPVYLNVTAVGGTPPYSYWYRGLPPDCYTLNNSSLTCHPGASQRYALEATVNDSAGAQANATTNLTVTSGFGLPPSILSFVAVPSPAPAGQIMHFLVNATSRDGTPTSVLSYAFLGLPTGCASFNQTNLSCIPTGGGMFKVWVFVTDGYSLSNDTIIYVTITGGATPSTPASSNGGGLLDYIAVGAIVGVVAAAGVVLAVRSRRLATPPPPGSR
jgi:hypothetical protein